MSQYADLIERLRELLEKATPGPYRAHDHRGMARVGAGPADWIGYAWVGRITENSGPNGAFDARWLDADRRKDACKEYRERAEHDVALVAEALNALPVLLDAIASLEAELQKHRLTELAALMSDISEDCWCAGWLVGNENSLYAMAFLDAPRRYGMGSVRDEDVERLKTLAEQTGQWFYHDDVEGITPIPLAEFAALHPGEKGK